MHLTEAADETRSSAATSQSENNGAVGFRQVIILILSVYVLIALVVQTTLPLDQAVHHFLDRVDFLVCAVFLVDFGVGFYRAPYKAEFLKWGWIDLLSSIPTVDALRWGRVVRLVRILRAIRSSRHLLAHLYRHRTKSLLGTATLSMLVLLTFCSMAVLAFEDGLDSTIRTPFDAFWWAISTMTTVGYGDKVPVSIEGKVVAIVLMVAGVALFGVLTGLFARLFLEPDVQQEVSGIGELAKEVRLLRIKVEMLEAKLSQDKSPEVPP